MSEIKNINVEAAVAQSNSVRAQGTGKTGENAEGREFFKVMREMIKQQKGNSEGNVPEEAVVLTENADVNPNPYMNGAVQVDLSLFIPQLPIQENPVADVSTSFLPEALDGDVQIDWSQNNANAGVPVDMPQNTEGADMVNNAKDNAETIVSQAYIPESELKSAVKTALPTQEQATKSTEANRANVHREAQAQKNGGDSESAFNQGSKSQSEHGRTEAKQMLFAQNANKPTEGHRIVKAVFAEAAKNAEVETKGEVMQPATAVVTESEAPKLGVKVGEGVNIYGKEFPKEIAEKIIFKQGEGVRQFDIELNPRELGKININILFKAGKAIVSLLCDNPRTQMLLNQHLHTIREIIETNTGTRTTVTAERNEGDEMTKREGFDDQGKHDRREQEQRRPRKEETDMFIHQLKLGMMNSA